MVHMNIAEKAQKPENPIKSRIYLRVKFGVSYHLCAIFVAFYL